MIKPKYASIAEMEAGAAREADNTVSLRLHNVPDPDNGRKAWLRVEYAPATGTHAYYYERGRWSTTLVRFDAVYHLAKEWEVYSGPGTH